MIKWLAKDNGFVHICGHRGHSIGSPENTLAAITATKEQGGSTCEIDLVLTKDDEIILLHDQTLDRTSDGKGLAESLTLAEIEALDAGAWFHPSFSGERIPTFAQAIRHAQSLGMGLVAEIKERRRKPLFIEKLKQALGQTGGIDDILLISFDHMDLKDAKAAIPGLKTEGITHARHGDIVGVARSAHLDAVSIEHLMFREADARALHEAGVAIRFHVQRPEFFARYAALGIDHRPEILAWLKAGLINSISGDDVGYLRALTREAAAAP